MAPFSIPSPSISSFELGPLTIHFYGVIILVGIIVATLITALRLKRRGVDPWVVLDIALWAVPLGVIGGRLYHVFTHPSDYFGEGKDLWEIVRVYNGGMAIFGAIILGLVGLWIATRIAGLRFWTVADAAAPGVLLAQGIGRWGNYFNQELFGTPTTLPWGIEIPSTNPVFPVGLPADTLFHPAFLYESIWDIVGAIVVLWASGRFKLQWGRTFGLYLVIYGMGRFWIENIRLDPSEMLLGIRVNALAAIAVVVVGLLLLRLRGASHPGLEPSPYRPGFLAKHPELAAPAAAADAGDKDEDGATAADERVQKTASPNA